MPNHITNRIRPDKDFELIREKVSSKRNDDELCFDFNKIIQKPKELEDTQSPAKIIPDDKFKKELDKYNKEIEKGKPFFSGRPISESESKSLIKKYGYNNWYDWSIENWGTKWNAYEDLTGYEEFVFDTAWSHPFEVINALSKMFPDIKFQAEFADEDLGSNCGSYTIKNGNVSDEVEGDFEFACKVKGIEYGKCKKCGKEMAVWDESLCYECEEG